MVLKYVSAKVFWKYLKSASIFRVLRVGHRRFEARVFHQFPARQVDAPGFRQAFFVTVFVTQLLEECTLGRYIGGHAQGAVGQGVTGFCIVTGTGPGQFVIGKKPISQGSSR